MFDDTIAAISTPPGEGGIGIVRLSGSRARKIGLSIFHFAGDVTDPESHRLYYGIIVDGNSGQHVDEALISFMDAPRTFTREDVVEINCHGGILPLSKTLELVLSAGARIAGPGEFTQRAFLNGRIDLAQAEAVIQVIRARTETAMKLGMAQLQGRLSREVRQIRHTLLTLLAHIEASIDFPEHHDVEELARDRLSAGIEKGITEITKLLETADKGRILREGIRTAIVGRPNVGKSSLLNALLQEQRAIVTNIPGTTRDLLEENINLGGVALTVMDTAGIRKAKNDVEKIGVQRSREALEKADLVLFLLDAARGITAADKEIIAEIGGKPCIVIANKVDLLENDHEETVRGIAGAVTPRRLVAMSLLHEKGLDELEQSILSTVFKGDVTSPESVMVTSKRHKNALHQAKEALNDLLTALQAGYAVDLLAIDLHTALTALGEITGETVGDQLAEEIFSTFCIGK
jgi:tRNA modification GTPase